MRVSHSNNRLAVVLSVAGRDIEVTLSNVSLNLERYLGRGIGILRTDDPRQPYLIREVNEK